MRNIAFSFSFGLALLIGAASQALAADAGRIMSTASPTSAAQAAAPPAKAGDAATAIRPDGFGPRVALATLATLSGGTSVSEQISLNGTVSQNTDDHVVTGSNVISASSFSGSAGLPTVIQNTGNNVLIQNATIVNVQFKP